MPSGSYLVMDFKASVPAHMCGSVAHIFLHGDTAALCPSLPQVSPWWEIPPSPSSLVCNYLRWAFLSFCSFKLFWGLVPTWTPVSPSLLGVLAARVTQQPPSPPTPALYSTSWFTGFFPGSGSHDPLFLHLKLLFLWATVQLSISTGKVSRKTRREEALAYVSYFISLPD